MASHAHLQGVTYTYPGADRPALRDIDLIVGPAEVVLVVGTSGGGKSTLLRCLNGLVPHFHGGTFAGRVTVDGLDTRTTPARLLARHVGLVFQDPESQSVMTTAEREIAFGLENIGVPAGAISRLVEEALISTNLSHLRHAPLAELSGGELQRVALAGVIAMQPGLLALDEPTSQLDPVSSEDILAAVRRLSEDTGSSILLAEHRIERCLHLATRVLVLEHGELVRDDEPTEFARWAARQRPLWLTPVGRLFSRRYPPQDAAEPPAHTLPFTVKDAHAQLAAAGPRPAAVPARPAAEAGAVVLSARGLSVGYDRQLPLAVGLDFELRRGEVVALMGENGVGKSTLVKHFNGLLRPLRGRVLLLGQDVSGLTVSQAARSCGYLGQNPSDYFVKDTVGAEIDYSLEVLGVAGEARAAARERTVATLDLGDLLHRDPRELSGGERTRAALATVTCSEPPLLVLDEPTRGVDPLHKAQLAAIMRSWAAADRCVLVVTHDVEFAARAASRVLILGPDGILADGPPTQVLDGALFFTTQVNRLLRDVIPGVLLDEDVTWEPRRP
jgi:energy-coupling factor transport system ATP-binding protein